MLSRLVILLIVVLLLIFALLFEAIQGHGYVKKLLDPVLRLNLET